MHLKITKKKKKKKNYTPTVSFAALDQGIEMIIFESILTTFEASSIFGVSIQTKSNQHMQIKLAKIGVAHCITQVLLLVLSCTNWEVLRKLSLPKLMKHIV
jgi:hypothetical protein